MKPTSLLAFTYIVWKMFIWFEVVTNSYPLVFFMVNFGKFRAIHCMFNELIIVTDMQNFTFINIKFHLPFFWPADEGKTI